MSTTQYVWPPNSSTSSNASVGTNGATAPTSSTQIAGENGGLLVPIAVTAGGNIIIDGSGTPVPVSGTVTANQGTAGASPWPTSAAQSGTWNITNVSGTVSLPTGASTSALQTTGNTALTTINTTLGSPFQAGGSIANTSFAATQATASSLNATVVGAGVAGTPSGGVVSVQGVSSGTPVTNIGGSLVVTNSVSSVTTLIASTDVSNYASISLQIIITGTAQVSFFGSNDNTNFQPLFMGYFQAGLPTQVASSSQIFISSVMFKYFKCTCSSYSNGTVTGTLVATQGSLNDPELRSIVVSNTPAVTQSGTWNITNVSGTVSLPTGASTAANQATEITSLASIVTNTTGAATAANQTTANTSLSSIVTNTTGVATAANQTTANTSLSTIATNTAAKSALGTFTDRSGTATGVSAQVAASNGSRKYFIIQNLDASNPLYINFTSAATAGGGSLKIVAGGSFVMESTFISTEAITAITGGGSIVYSAKEG